jgi:arsenite-transporting ATPase
MSRIILQCGKGGVGKTTVSAATGLAAAQRGHRTLVMSFDLAHSLGDSFDQKRSLFDQNKGRPVKITDHLDIQEIDIQEELERHWKDVSQYFSLLFSSAGVSEVMADEMAIWPGMEDLVTFLYINQYLTEGTYDLIVVDCPPTGESIRFFSMTATLEWYMTKRFKVERKLLKLARPLTNLLDSGVFPDDKYFNALERLSARIRGVDKVLTDHQVTTVRLVTNAERMVIKETQRAYMYFNLYNINVDMIVANRILPADQEYFKHWAKAQAGYIEDIKSYFHPLPVQTLPMMEHEVVGLERLGEFARRLFGDGDPMTVRSSGRQFSFEKTGDSYLLHLRMPFVDRKDIDLTKHENDLIVRVGSFKRFVPLPRAIAVLEPSNAQYIDQELRVTFR